jgi:hypothetical protein
MMERLRESRWVYILISVLLAVVFWLYIRDTEDPTMSRPIYNVPVQIANERVLEERGLTVSGLSQSSLTVEVTGPVSVLNNLTRSNITASVDVSSITETGEHELNCRLILPNNVDTTGAFFPEQSNPVTVTVDTLVTETMNVEVRLEGSELNKRLAISEFFFHNEKHIGKEENVFRDGLNRQEVEGIRIILRLVCREFSIVLSDASLSNLVIHVFIALTRYRFYNFIEADEALQAEYRDAVEYAAAKRLTEALEEAYDFVIPDDEVIYYAMHLRVKRIYDEIPLTDQERVRINQCISQCFWEIYEEYGVDFSQDQELRHYLYQHIPLMIIRLKNHMSFRYPQVLDKPSSYLFSIKLTYIVTDVIGRFYQVGVNAQEFEYLAIYFCFALLKSRSGKRICIGVYKAAGRRP